ncbi:MAG: hypothetical protein L0228_06700 [Planctomycetes bacterium]|nr:hypothetical protein [Planctomycetota bacterium]
MRNPTLKRREFTKLSAAAFGGLLAGSTGLVAAQEEEREDKRKLLVDPALLLEEPHVCRGLNTCRGKGKGEQNACMGQGACAVVKEHSCNGENDCKGMGGCGGYPGQNTCKGKGHCAVALKKETWAIARKQLEHLMADAGKKLGAAPK